MIVAIARLVGTTHNVGTKEGVMAFDCGNQDTVP